MRLVHLALAPLALTSAASAQQILDYVLPPEAGARIGAALAAAGDVDGDGVADLLMGGYLANGGPNRVWVLSGRTRDLLYTVTDFLPNSAGYQDYPDLASIGDVDGDGVPDFVVGAPVAETAGAELGAVQLHSGASGALLWRRVGLVPGERFGNRVAAVGDVDGDGIPDVAVAAYHRSYPDGVSWIYNAGAVDLLSGADGARLLEVSPMQPARYFGTGLAGPGDLDGDGVPDFVAGAYLGGPTPSFRPGSVTAVSGADGSTLHERLGVADGSYLGDAVVAVGDQDGDGIDDLLTTATFEQVGSNQPPGRARVLSGASGAELWQTSAGPLLPLQAPLADLGDLDGDGAAEFSIASTTAEVDGVRLGRVRVYSGADRSLLYELWGQQPDGFFGSAVMGAGDLDGDGAGEFLIGVPFVDYGGGGFGAGLVLVMRSGPCVALPRCASTPNSVGAGAFLASVGSLSLAANDFTLVANGLPPGATGLFFGAEPEPSPPFQSRGLCLAQEGGIHALPPYVVADGSGHVSHAVDLSTLGIAALHPYRFQLLYRDPAAPGAPLRASDALELVACP